MDDTIDREVVSMAEWVAARTSLQQKEDSFLDALDGLNNERRDLPMVRFAKEYSFAESEGARSLLELFDGRRQLIVYHFWFEPGGAPCPGCSMWASNLGDVDNLHARDTSFVFVSRAGIEDIEAVKAERGWSMPWLALVGDGFSADTGYAGVAQLSIFLHHNDEVFLTYVTREGRDLETISSHWTLLDRTPSGR